MAMKNCSSAVLPIRMPCQPGIRLICQRGGRSMKKPAIHITITNAIAYAQVTLMKYSASTGSMRRAFHSRVIQRYLATTCTPPMAQRRRCCHRPRRVSGIRIQHSARGSKRTAQCWVCSFQLMSMSSVSMSGLQNPHCASALRRNAVTTPETVKMRP